MKTNFTPQVPKDHYFKDYDSWRRFISYWYQIESVLETKTKKILEVGVGNKTVSDYLKKQGLNVTTCDFASDLKPDVVADVRHLPFKDNSFDSVLCCEVLEHIPYQDVPQALSELKRVSQQHVIISLPYSGFGISGVLTTRFPRLRDLIIRFNLQIPLFFKGIIFDGVVNKEHYWEVGRRGFSKNRVRKLLRRFFTIEKEFHPPLVPSHWFVVLRLD